MARCATCRHHSKVTRGRVLSEAERLQVLSEKERELQELGAGLDDADREQWAEHDTELEDVFSCMKQGGKEIGIGLAAGEGCSLYEIGQAGTIDESLERLVRAQAARGR